MKVLHAIAAASVLVLTGCASQGEFSKSKLQIQSMEESMIALNARQTQLEERMNNQPRPVSQAQAQHKIDHSKFCFADGMAFSEGGIYNSRLCKRQGFVMAYDGRPSTPALVWVNWNQSGK